MKAIRCPGCKSVLAQLFTETTSPYDSYELNTPYIRIERGGLVYLSCKICHREVQLAQGNAEELRIS
jgi:hypothetical protein